MQNVPSTLSFAKDILLQSRNYFYRKVIKGGNVALRKEAHTLKYRRHEELLVALRNGLLAIYRIVFTEVKGQDEGHSLTVGTYPVRLVQRISHNGWTWQA
jgi:hypothetical protein